MPLQSPTKTSIKDRIKDPPMDQRDIPPIHYDGRLIVLTEDADNVADPNKYTAAAEDKEGNEYRVEWRVTQPDAPLIQDRCDWTEYVVYDADDNDDES